MATKNDTGIFQKENGYWEYRFRVMVNGKQVSQHKSTDAYGQKLRTKREAIAAKEAALVAVRAGDQPPPRLVRWTVSSVFEHFAETGRMDRAYQTIRKQDSLWENHLKKRFGNRFVDDITSGEVNDYLAELYYVEGFSYQYVESFLKMFYLIFGQAYSHDHLEVTAYNKLCTNKNTKIRMPKLKADDDTNIVSFSREQLAILDDYFRGTNAETAYLLGRYCGLRINEAFGLKWENVDLENGTIQIDRQMQYQDSLIKLIAPKTRNSNRTIYLPEPLLEHLREKYRQRQEHEKTFRALRKQNRRMIEDIDGTIIPSTDLVNCLPDGKIQTVNSMKYPTREIKSRLKIEFKYHYLRHTYGTMMAELNTPQHLLCSQMGHGNIHVTQRYYLSISKDGIDILKENLKRL